MFTAALFTAAKTQKQPIDRCMDTQNVVYLYNGILLSLKEEGHSDTCYMDEP